MKYRRQARTQNNAMDFDTMSSTTAFLASFVSVLIGAAIGMILKRSLSADLLKGGSKEAIRLGAGLLATLAALVIGLMIASAENTFDTQNTNIRQLGTNAVLLDQMLTKYGPTQSQRAPCCAKSSRRPLPGSGGKTSSAATDRTRLLVFTQSDNAIPVPFFIVLTFWLVVIFASFSLFTAPNGLVIAAVLVFALSVSSTLFLIVDLGHPFDGLMQISNHHLHAVLPKVE
jgi:hypothetical protein